MRLAHCAVIASALFASLYAFANPVEISSPINKVFIPGGFDNNDNVEILLAGEFSNPCFKVGHTSFKIDDVKKTIRITATSYQYDGEPQMCPQMITPFLQKVSVGILKAAKYKVEVNEASNLDTAFSVTPSHSQAADDFLYAPVSNAQLNDNDGAQQLVLQGTFPRMLKGCMVIDHVAITNEPNVIVVQPVAKILDVCPEAYNYKFIVAKELESAVKSFGLLHVRVMNGNSINLLIDNGVTEE